MNKNLQSTIGFSALIIAVSVAYYLFSYIPERNKQNVAMSLQKQCIDLGTQKQKEDSKYNKEISSDGSSYITDFVFDKKTSECFYRSVYMASGGIMQKTIIDLFTNKQLGYYSEITGLRILAGDKAAYEKIEDYHF